MINKRYIQVNCNASELIQCLADKSKENENFDFKGLFKDKELPNSGKSCREIIKKGNDLDTFYLFYTTTWTSTHIESKQNYIVELKKINKEVIGYRVFRKPLFRLKLFVILSITSIFFIWLLLNHFSPFNFIIPVFLIMFFRGFIKSKKDYELYIEKELNSYDTTK